MQFQDVYGELFRLGQFQKFNEENFCISGLTFRTLVQEAVEMVTENYNRLKEDCTPKWNYHSFGWSHLWSNLDKKNLPIFVVKNEPYDLKIRVFFLLYGLNPTL